MAGWIVGHTAVNVANSLAAALGGEAVPVRGRKAYIHRGGFVIRWGGVEPAVVRMDKGRVCFECHGPMSDDFTKTLRSTYPEHRVMRADVCEDYDDPGIFDLLASQMKAAKPANVSDNMMGGTDPAAGRTYYIGTRSEGSLALVRLYESGKRKGHASFGRMNCVRLELESRPRHAIHQVRASTMTPEEFWGFVRWTAVVAAQVFNMQIARVAGPPRKQAQLDALAYVAIKFRQKLEAACDGGVDLNEAFKDIWDRVDERRAVAAQARGPPSMTKPSPLTTFNSEHQ